jgi:hypothetical protein
MVLILFLSAIVAGGFVGLMFGYGLSQQRSEKALKLARYRDAIALANDLVKTPDALDLRSRAQKLLAEDRKANPAKE